MHAVQVWRDYSLFSKRARKNGLNKEQVVRFLWSPSVTLLNSVPRADLVSLAAFLGTKGAVRQCHHSHCVGRIHRTVELCIETTWIG